MTEKRALVLLGGAGLVLLGAGLWVPLLMAGVFSILLWPLQQRLTLRWGWRPLRSAALLTSGLTFLFLTPAAVLIFIAARGVTLQIQSWKNSPRVESGDGFYESVIHNEAIHRFLEKLSSWFPVGIEEITQGAEDLIRTVGVKVGELAAAFLSELPGTAMGTLVMILSVFFLLQDGPKLARALLAFHPGEAGVKERFSRIVSLLCRSVILASLASGAVQASVFGLALVGVGSPYSGLLTLLVFLCSFLPLVGSAPMTFGAALHTFFILQDRTSALALLLVALVVSVLDNVVRPWVLKGSGNLHPLVAFVAAFGGIQVFGFSGVFLGPILAGICVELLTMSEGAPEENSKSDSPLQGLQPSADEKES